MRAHLAVILACVAVMSRTASTGDGVHRRPLRLDEPRLRAEVQPAPEKAKPPGLGQFRAEKLEGDALGFYTTRRPFATWESWVPDKRLSGPVAKVCSWSEVQSVVVLYALLHIRGPADVENVIKLALSDAEFVKAMPEGMVLRPADEDARLSVQALLKLKDGTYALLSVASGYAVLEHRRQVGLIIGRKPRR